MHAAPFPLSLLLTNECFDVFFYQWNFLHFECLKHTAAKGLGYAIVGASALLKAPIMSNVFKAQSTAGLSLTSLVLEQSVLTAATANSFIKGMPFSTYGESVMIGVQNVVLMALMGWFGQSSAATIGAVLSALAAFSYGCAMMPAAHADKLIWCV